LCVLNKDAGQVACEHTKDADPYSHQDHGQQAPPGVTG
jgi:hypothetical protein